MGTNAEITTADDVIDSRDVITRIANLTRDRDSGQLTYAETAELAALESLAADAEGYAADWQCGATLIRDSYFTEYAMEMLRDCEVLPKDLPWYVVIDEDATAKNVRDDYTAVDFDGVAYWIR